MSKKGITSFIALVSLFATAGALADKTHMVKGTVVSVDAKAHTLTLKGSDGKTSTAPVEGAAMNSLGNLKSGDAVTVTCRDNDKGEHQAVTAIAVDMGTKY